MTDTKVCVVAGMTGAKEYSMMEKYASQGWIIAFMDTNKELGRMIKAELENIYQVTVFFFHGDVANEEDRDIFFAAVQDQYGPPDYIFCQEG